MLVVFLCLLLVAHAAGQLTTADRTTLINLHNNVRANPTSIGAPVPSTPLVPLQWDDTIAATAQQWASKCTLNSSPNWASLTYGENLVYMYPPQYANLQTMFNYFTSAAQYFNFATKQCAPGKSCAAFQQVMGAATTHFGCATAICNFNGPSTFLVCNYKAFGQFTGTRPYTPANSSPAPNPTTAPTRAPTPATSAPTRAPTPATTAPTPATPAPTKAPTPATPAPTNGYPSIDYRNTYLVQPVKDQKSCGSCWAFGAVAMAESAIALARNGQIQPLSEQSVLDCSTSGSCKGGWPPTALQEIINRKGVDSMSSYAYTNVKSTCKSNSANFGGAIKAKYSVAKTMDATYQALKKYGPLGIAVNANDNWYSYRSGVMSYASSQINHAVTIVGYDSPKNAWIVRNSWGPSWGTTGHIYLDAANPGGAYINGAWYATA